VGHQILIFGPQCGSKQNNRGAIRVDGEEQTFEVRTLRGYAKILFARQDFCNASAKDCLVVSQDNFIHRAALCLVSLLFAIFFS
jgi:hypothetical protein